MPHNVTFNEEPQFAYRPTASTSKKQGSIIGLMYKLGVARTEKDANVVMMGIVLACLIVSATMFVFIQPHASPTQQAALQRDLERMQASQAQQAASAQSSNTQQ